MKYILDTCVVSDLISKKPNSNVINWIVGNDPDFLFLSAITIGEIQRGISKSTNAAKAIKLQEWLDDDLLVKFNHRILPINSEVMIGWGKLYSGLEKIGITVSVMDSLIGATAIHYNCKLVTRNTSDFLSLGIEVVNPWMEIRI